MSIADDLIQLVLHREAPLPILLDALEEEGRMMERALLQHDMPTDVDIHTGRVVPYLRLILPSDPQGLREIHWGRIPICRYGLFGFDIKAQVFQIYLEPLGLHRNDAERLSSWLQERVKDIAVRHERSVLASSAYRCLPVMSTTAELFLKPRDYAYYMSGVDLGLGPHKPVTEKRLAEARSLADSSAREALRLARRSLDHVQAGRWSEAFDDIHAAVNIEVNFRDPPSLAGIFQIIVKANMLEWRLVDLPSELAYTEGSDRAT